MRKADKLFDLIKSLSKTEKGYFKKHSSKHIVGDKNNYVKIFEVIDTLKEYDEKKIKEAFKGQKLANHLSSEKDYLYQNILNSLIAYHSDNSPTYKLYKYINQISLLYDKALYVQCKKLLIKAKKLAILMDEFPIIFELIKYDKKLLVFESNLKIIKENREAIIKEENRIISIYQNFISIWNLYSEIMMINRSAGSTSIKELKKNFKNVIDNPILKSIDNAMSVTAKSFWQQIFSVYYYAIRDFDNWYIISEEMVDFIEKHPHLLASAPYRYVISLSNLLIGHQVTGNTGKSFQENLKKYRAIEVKDKNIETLIFTNSYNLELTTYTYSGDFVAAEKVANKIIDLLPKYNPFIGPTQEAIIVYNISYVYFGLENYDKALDWINKILYDIKLDIRQDVYCFAKLFSLIVHYELNNMLLINSYAISTKKYLDKREVITNTEVIFLKFLKKISDTYGKKNIIEAFKKLKIELTENFKNDSEKSFLQYFDILDWIESKIVEVPFKTIIQKKHSKTKNLNVF